MRSATADLTIELRGLDGVSRVLRRVELETGRLMVPVGAPSTPRAVRCAYCGTARGREERCPSCGATATEARGPQRSAPADTERGER